ncbi:MAG: hypothetical protein HY579_08665 [Nitrospinae bacterium]|nr:hypothetical protein [Nitrospinota bacterium]
MLNFGMGGYSTDQEHELMKAVLRHVECDLVIIGFYENDFQPTTKGILSSFAVMDKIDLSDPKSKDLEIFNRPDRSSPLSISPQYFRGVVPWHEKTLIYKLIEDRTNINIHKLPGDFERNYLFSEFSGIMELTKRHRLPPPVVALLYAGDVPPNKNDFRNPTGHLARHIHLMRFVGENLRKNGFSVVDPLPLFQKYNKMSMAVSEWDRHPNYLSHYVYARSIYDFLTAKVLDPALIDKSNDL